MTGRRLLSFADAGKELGGVSYKTVQRYVADGELPVVNVAAPGSTRPRLRIDSHDLDTFIKARKTPARKAG